MINEHLGENYTGANLEMAHWSGHVYEDCTFKGCDFKGLSLANCQLMACTLINCDLSNVNMSNARLRDMTFENCKLLGIQWVQLNSFVNPTFRQSHLDYSNFIGLKLKKNIFTKCRLRDVDFSQTDLSECDFQESDFLNARFHNTKLLKANFRGAVNYLIDPVDNLVRGAHFSMPEAQGLLAGLGIFLE